MSRPAFAPFTLREIADRLQVSLPPAAEAIADDPVAGLDTDSRAIAPGSVFAALRGERFDGHAFVGSAFERGAIAALVERPTDDAGPQVVVPNALAAYQTLGRAWRDRADIPVVAITGSVGKTTVKELTAAVLGTAGSVLKTHANYNNEIGVPKTLLQLDASCDFAVVELAMRGRGQIAELARIARPTVAVVANVGTAHIELLGSEAAIAEAKCELLAELEPERVAILNADCDRLLQTAARVRSGPTLTYGLVSGDLRGEIVEDGRAIAVAGDRFPLPLPGRHNASNFLAALAVAKVLGASWEPLKAGIAATLPAGRARRVALPGDVVLLDETYNAGLESMTAALHLLAETPGRRRLAVLGAMKELGAFGPEFHRRVGETARSLALDGLFVLADDPVARHLADGAAGLPCERFDDRAALIDRLRDLAQPGDRWLFKASRSVGLDAAVAALAEAWGAGEAPAATRERARSPFWGAKNLER